MDAILYSVIIHGTVWPCGWRLQKQDDITLYLQDHTNPNLIGSYCQTWVWYNRKLCCLLAATGRAASQAANRQPPGILRSTTMRYAASSPHHVY
jgi:hypothetical protein